jgi:hypothetical protein
MGQQSLSHVASSNKNLSPINLTMEDSKLNASNQRGQNNKNVTPKGSLKEYGSKNFSFLNRSQPGTKSEAVIEENFEDVYNFIKRAS